MLIKDCSRIMSDEDVEVWKRGEKLLKKWIGIELNSTFERDGDWINVSYDEKEGERVHEAIKKFLTDENFDKLCDDFVDLIIQKHEIAIKMMPALIIFDEIDNYPYIATEDMKRRLMRLRTSTHEESYKK